MPRKFCVGGNWKMNGDKKSIMALCRVLTNATLDENTEVVLGCPFVYINYVRDQLPCRFQLAGQNCYKELSGAFTGEVSPAMLQDVGADWVIIGHSERRQIFLESNQLVAEKAALALQQGLKVILCIGESADERTANKTEEVVAQQMTAFGRVIEDWSKVVIAYEPIWAIGTGETATPLQAQQVHAFLRQWLTDNVSKEVADEVRIQYGGSVNAGNCRDLAKQPDIDGFLVGGASLKAEFVDIINAKK